MNKPIAHNNEKLIRKGTQVLFLVQIFATLSYAVLWSTLIFFLTKGLKINDQLATDITAEFIALSFFLHLLGGVAGGRLFSFRSLFVISMLLQLVGLGLLSFADIDRMYWALAIYLSGNGFNMTCINCLLTQLFSPEDQRREKAFSWNYSGMNIGYLIGFTMGGYFLLNGNYQTLFILSSFASIISLLGIFIGWSSFTDKIIREHISLKTFAKYLFCILLLVLLVISIVWLLQHILISNLTIIIIVASVLLFIAGLAFKSHSKKESHQLSLYLILFMAATCFYTISQLAPMGLDLFINRNVSLHIAGFTVTPQWLQNLNPIVIIISSPLWAYFYQQLRARGFNITTPLQFGIALLIMGLSMVILPVGIHLADSKGFTHISWPILSIGLQGFAEAAFTPIGFAMVGQLAPARWRGLLTGNWLASIGMGAIFAGYFSKYALGNFDELNPLVTNVSYGLSFSILGWLMISIGCVLLIIRSFLDLLIK